MGKCRLLLVYRGSVNYGVTPRLFIKNKRTDATVLAECNTCLPSSLFPAISGPFADYSPTCSFPSGSSICRWSHGFPSVECWSFRSFFRLALLSDWALILHLLAPFPCSSLFVRRILTPPPLECMALQLPSSLLCASLRRRLSFGVRYGAL